MGAGIAGLTLSLALARLGLQSVVLEARPEPSTDGAGIQLGPNATAILDQLGILDPVAQQAGRPDTIIVRRIGNGQTIAQLPLPSPSERRGGTPYLVAHRSVLHSALLEAVQSHADIDLRFGNELQDVEQEASKVVARTTDGVAVTGRVIVGCDGLWSRVRQHIAPGFQLTYSGMTAARAVLPIEQAPQSLRDPNTGVWLGSEAHIVKYPIDAGRNVALIVVRRQPQRLVGWGHDIDGREVLQQLPSLVPELLQLLSAASSWRQWALYDPKPMAGWSSGRAAVIGDAAHPVLPFLAQGGAMAIEDGFVLAKLLSRHDGPAAFHAFEKLRRPRVTRVQQASRKNGQIYHLSGVAAAMRDAAMQLLPAQQLMRRYDWIYDWRP